MDITGKIIWAGDRRGGISQQSGKSWASQDFTIESRSNGPYGEVVTRVAFSVFGEDKLNQWQPRIGDQVTVGYGVNAHEYQGKWFNEVRAYKYEKTYPAPLVQGGSQYAPSQGGYQQMPNQQYQQQTAAANYGGAPYGTQATY